MKNLGRTIDRIIKIEPSLEEKLLSIKSRWKKYPSRYMNYWKELIDYLNASVPQENRLKIKEILSSSNAKKTPIYSFEEISATDRVLGAIPENIADRVRFHDRQSIDVAKLNTEAEITKNVELKAVVARKEASLDIQSKKLWFQLKDIFQLWKKPSNYSIKKNKGLLVMVENSSSNMPSFIGPGLVKMDETTLRQFLQYLGYPPPSSE